MKHLLLTLFLLIVFPLSIAAKEVEKRGTVKDAAGEGLPGIMVLIKDADDNNVAYAITDRNGAFSISYQDEDASKLRLTLSCLGFKTISMPLRQLRDNAAFVMEETDIVLKEVTVRNAPISSVGDTLTYNVASFKSASDRSIEDIIRKLPGIRVEDNGRIYYNGEPINKFYIEGLDLLAGRYALASRNISPNDVTAVNIYENHQPTRVLKDVVFSENAALNLKLKKKSMLKPIGYVKGGIGLNDADDVLWLGEAFSLLITPTRQMLLSAKANRAGVSYINETKNLISDLEDSPTQAFGIYPDIPFGKADIPSARYYDNRSVSASVNAINRLSEFSTFNITADYTDELNNYDNSSAVTYTTDNAMGTTISESVANRPHSREAKLKLKFENNNPKRYLKDELSFTGHFNSDRYSIFSDRSISQTNSTRDYNISNRFNGILSISRYMLNFKSNIQFSTTPVSSLHACEAGGTPIIMQNVKGSLFSTREELGYSWNINSRSYIAANLIFQLAHERYRSIIDTPPGSPSNDIRGYDIATTIEPSYQYKFNRGVTFTLKAPIRLHNLKFDNLPTGRHYPTNRLDVDLRATIRYNTPFNLRTSLSAGRLNHLGSISDYITEPVYLTFRQQSTLGNALLGQRTSYFATSNLSYRNTVEGLFSSASITYRHTLANRLGNLNVSDGNLESDYKNIDNRSNIFSANGSFSKKVYGWGTSFGIDGGYELMKRDIMRGDVKMNMRINGYNVRLNVNSNPINNYLIADFTLKYSRTSQKVQGASSGSHTDALLGKLTLATRPLQWLELGAGGHYSRSLTGTGVVKNSFFTDCYVRSSLKRFDLELSAKNLTNTREYSYSYMLDSDLYYYSFALRPFEVLLTVKYTY